MTALRRAAVALTAVTLAAAPAAAQYQTIDLSAVTNGGYCSTGLLANCLSFPSGMQTLGGVPFDIDQQGPPAEARAWFAHTAAGGAGGNVSLTVPVGIFGVTDVYTLINTFWGVGGPDSYASLTFNGSAGAVFTLALVGNDDVRDYNQFVWTNAINGTTTVEVFNTNVGQRLDRQHIALPAAFAGQTLTSIVLSDVGGPNFQRTFLSGVTVGVSAVPEPATMGLVAGGLLVLGVGARRRARAG